MQTIIKFFQVPLHRELSLAALLVLFLVLYYLRYVHFAKMPDSRHARRQLTSLIGGTRWLVLATVVAMVGLIIYDRVLPHSTNQAATAASAKVVSSHQQAKKKTKAKAKPKTKAKKTAKAKASKQSSAEIIPDTTEQLSTLHYTALQVVEKYYAAHPGASEAAEAYRFRSDKIGNAGAKVTEIGGYEKVGSHRLRLTHIYWVYPNGMFDLKR